MRIFVCEFITGGGLYREPMTPTLAKEGMLMRNALLSDLSALLDVELTTTYDLRLKAPLYGCQAIPIQLQDDVWQVWAQCIQQADAVWLIAPETGGLLTRLTALVTQYNKPLLGCSVPAVEITSSKLLTSKALNDAGIATLATYQFAEWLQRRPEALDGWVAKMDNGAGCEDSAYFKDVAALIEWMHPRKSTHVIQAYQPGQPASISMLCRQGQAWLLSCNLQKITIEQGRFCYAGSVINGMAEYWDAFERIAQQVAQALPGLAGYVGIDLIVGADDSIEVLEINPRLTTSYVGLHSAIKYNPAQLVLELLHYNEALVMNEAFVMPHIARHKVEVSLHA
ncbi:MAG: ATP-grasp domain-containing protein [Methylophilaceae bacterium]